MKALKFFAPLAMAGLFAIPAFAAGNKTSFEITGDTVVAGKTLSPGKYNVAWEGQGPTVDLNISKGKQVVATVPARVLELPKPLVAGATIVKTNPDGTVALSEIQITGKKYVLEISEPNGPSDVASRVK
jgi:hypothetical protein